MNSRPGSRSDRHGGPRTPLPVDPFDAWRRRLLPLRLAGLALGVVIAAAAPHLARALADQVGQPSSGAFTDLVGASVPTLVALPFLRAVAYRRRDALLIFFIPLAGFWLLAKIGWRLPVILHPDWPLRPAEPNHSRRAFGLVRRARRRDGV